jgi:hypothetical protein
VDKIESFRSLLYSALEVHCYQKCPADKTRFAKLLLRLPSLRSISLKCTSLLFFSQLFPNLPFEKIFMRLLSPKLKQAVDLRVISSAIELEEYIRRMSTLFSQTAADMAIPSQNMYSWNVDNTGQQQNYYGKQNNPSSCQKFVFFRMIISYPNPTKNSNSQPSRTLLSSIF